LPGWENPELTPTQNNNNPTIFLLINLIFKLNLVKLCELQRYNNFLIMT